MSSSMRGGGSEQQTLLLLKHLDRRKFAPQLYLTESTGDLMEYLPDDVPVHSFEPSTKQKGLSLPGKTYRKQISHLKSLLVEQSIEVIYDRTFQMSLLAGPAAKTTRTPRISTIVSPPELALPLLVKRYRWMKRRKLRKAYRQSHKVIAVSQQALRSAKQYYGLSAQNLCTISNPVDRKRLTQLSENETVERDDRWTFACVARMTKEKGHLDLIHAMHLLEETWPEHLPGIHLWLIGDGPLRQQLKQKTESLKFHQVSFLGKQANPWKFMKAADAVVVPSLFEGMPNVVLESMSLRTPVIATRIGGTNELEIDKPTIWWVSPQAPNSIANAMIDLATRPNEVNERLDAAELLLHKNHDIQNQVRQIESLLQDACADKPA